MALPPIDLSLPRWDQSTYWGRARHFFTITNPANLWVTSARLAAARDTVIRYKRGELNHLTEEEVWRAKQLYDSAFHPETGEKMPVAGRMAAQVPCSALIVGGMLTWHKTVPAVVFWQLANQSFNALVNYTNRSGNSPPPLSTLALSYVAATGSALATALTLNSLVHSLPPLAGRLVPFLAVTAGNCINIPLMRRTELSEGVLVKTEEGLEVGHSKVAARRAIAMVVLSRVAMAVPGMGRIPLTMPKQILVCIVDTLGRVVGYSCSHAISRERRIKMSFV